MNSGDLVYECFRCGQWYNQRNNIGAFLCRYHPKPLAWRETVEGYAPGTHACCGVSPRAEHRHYAGPEAALGCRRAHHRTVTPSRGEPVADDDELIFPIDSLNETLGHDAAVALLDSASATIDERTQQVRVTRHENPNDYYC